MHRPANVFERGQVSPAFVEFETIQEYVHHWSQHRPDAPALHVLGRRRRTLNYIEFQLAVAATARRLADAGVGQDDAVVVACNLDERHPIAMAAIASLGAVAVPILLQSDAARHALTDFRLCRSVALVCATRAYRKFMQAAFPDFPDEKIMSIDEPADPMPAAVDLVAWWRGLPRRRCDESVYANMTSGSTARPKIVLATHRQLLANARSTAAYFGITAESRMCCMFVHHLHEHFLRPLLVGGCAVLVPLHGLTQPPSLICREGRVTHLMTNPHAADRMSSEPTAALEDLGELQSIEIGGGIVDAEVVRVLEAKAKARVLTAYGATELGGAALANRWQDEPGCDVLWPLPGYALEFVRAEDREGIELVIQGTAVASGYLTPPPGEIALDRQRFQTRDLVNIVDGGGVVVVGRADNAVKILGSRQPLEPIEGRLKSGLRGVAEAVQCLDVCADRATGVLSTFLVALVLLKADVREQWRGRERRLVRRALRAAKLQTWLTAPRYFLFVEPDEIGLCGGKVIRSHARRRFPSSPTAWDAAARARLIPSPHSIGDVARALQRGVAELRSIGSPWRAAWAIVRQAWWRRPQSAGTPGSPTMPPERRAGTPGKWLLRAVIFAVIAVVAGLIALGLFEDALVFRRGGYYHPPSSDFCHEELWLATEDGLRLHAWYCPAPHQDTERYVVVYCHGTFGELTFRASLADDWREAINADVVLFDYRGYGLSEGSPSEAGLARDARAVYRFLTVDRRIDPQRIIFVGRSLGGAVAIDLASAVEVRAVILESTFTSLADVADDLAGGLALGALLRNRFPSLDRIGSLKAPVLIAHGDHDAWIDLAHSRRLYDAAPEPKRFVVLPNHRHVDVPGADYYARVRQFLAETSPPTRP